jgi:hypothetical protein
VYEQGNLGRPLNLPLHAHSDVMQLYDCAVRATSFQLHLKISNVPRQWLVSAQVAAYLTVHTSTNVYTDSLCACSWMPIASGMTGRAPDVSGASTKKFVRGTHALRHPIKTHAAAALQPLKFEVLIGLFFPVDEDSVACVVAVHEAMTGRPDGAENRYSLASLVE